jgi:glycosyltransferase involved in cell wall biosynthesis
MTSVIIAAHDEGAVLGRCLDALLSDATPGELDIIVAANGCTDDTAGVALARTGVRVLDLPEAGKVGALNAGDAVAKGFPRLYLDADIVLTTGAVRALAAAVSVDGPGSWHALAAAPRRELDIEGRSLMVRAYFAIQSRLPAFDGALFGRGVVALSESGRARFDQFPDVIADDLFLDSLFLPDEKLQVDDVSARVATPRRTKDLVRRLVRVRRGNAALRAEATSGAGTVSTPTAVRSANQLSWLRDVVLPRPWLAPAGVCYAGIALLAELLARRAPSHGAQVWERDESSRAPAIRRAEQPDRGQG